MTDKEILYQKLTQDFKTAYVKLETFAEDSEPYLIAQKEAKSLYKQLSEMEAEDGFWSTMGGLYHKRDVSHLDDLMINLNTGSAKLSNEEKDNLQNSLDDLLIKHNLFNQMLDANPYYKLDKRFIEQGDDFKSIIATLEKAIKEQ